MFSGRLKVETLVSMFGLAREAVEKDYTVGRLHCWVSAAQVTVPGSLLVSSKRLLEMQGFSSNQEAPSLSAHS